jgi:DNA-binding Lrp family transcriptional regulator
MIATTQRIFNKLGIEITDTEIDQIHRNNKKINQKYKFITHNLPKLKANATSYFYELYNYISWETNLLVDKNSVPLNKEVVAKLFNVDEATVYRNMKELEINGIIKGISFNNCKYYVVNPKFMYYRNIKNSKIDMLFQDQSGEELNVPTTGEEKKDCGIYKIRNIKTNFVYIGSSKNISLRWRQHISALELGRHQNYKLQKAWNEYGKTKFNFSIIELTPLDELLKYEQYWIDYYDSANEDVGYNISENAGHFC